MFLVSEGPATKPSAGIQELARDGVAVSDEFVLECHLHGLNVHLAMIATIADVPRGIGPFACGGEHVTAIGTPGKLHANHAWRNTQDTSCVPIPCMKKLEDAG